MVKDLMAINYRIDERNQNKQINISVSDSATQAYHSVNFRKDHLEKMIPVLDNNGTPSLENSTPPEIGAFHELVHLYHFLLSPGEQRIYNADVKIGILSNNGFKEKIEAAQSFASNHLLYQYRDEDSPFWGIKKYLLFLNHGIALYVDNLSLDNDMGKEDNLIINIDMEEFFTIVGDIYAKDKLIRSLDKNMRYTDFSENAYRKALGKPLRYSHYTGFKEFCDKQDYLKSLRSALQDLSVLQKTNEAEIYIKKIDDYGGAEDMISFQDSTACEIGEEIKSWAETISANNKLAMPHVRKIINAHKQALKMAEMLKKKAKLLELSV